MLYEHAMGEQTPPFKSTMKLAVRRSATTGVGFVKLGFRRVTETRPESADQVADIRAQLARMEGTASDLRDGEITGDDAPADELRAQIAKIESEAEFVVREGLEFHTPQADAIIVDPRCKTLKHFRGASWVAEEYMMSTAEVRRVFGVTLSAGSFSGYSSAGGDDLAALDDRIARLVDGDPLDEDGSAKDVKDACVWEVYDKDTGLVYFICDGYEDFLREPAAPAHPLERFWPWFAIVSNECDDPKSIYPPSDVRLLMDMQMEINRSREALRQHRIAARPRTVTRQGALSAEDKAQINAADDHVILELEGLQPGQKVQDLIQAFNGPSIDPNLYQTNMVFEDMLRAVGTQEANLGTMSGGSATEANIAKASAQTSQGSDADELNELLTEMAREGGHLLMRNMSEEQVKRVVGPGAVWPELTLDDIEGDIWLEVQANSSGRPNQAQEVRNAQAIFPLLMQLPNIDPQKLAAELLKRMDDQLDIKDFYQRDLPSVVALNGMKAAAPGMGTAAAQGAQGAANTPTPPGGSPGAAPPGADQMAADGAPPQTPGGADPAGPRPGLT